MNKKDKKAIRNLPVKRSVNLLPKEKNNWNWKIGVPALVLIIAVAFAIGKFAVYDRLAKLYELQSQVAKLETGISEGYEKIESFGDLNITYGHYTYSDFTEEELTRTDRMEVVDLLDRIVFPQCTVISWSVDGLTVQIPIANVSLAKANEIALDLEADDLVDFCTVTSATTGNVVTRTDDYQNVVAQLTIYLNPEVSEE